MRAAGFEGVEMRIERAAGDRGLGGTYARRVEDFDRKGDLEAGGGRGSGRAGRGASCEADRKAQKPFELP